MNLNQVLESVPLNELLQTIENKAKNGSKDTCAYIRGIFQGSMDSSDESENRRYETFKSSLLILQMTDLPHNLSTEIASLLMLNIDTFHTSNLMKLSKFFVEYTKDPHVFSAKWVEIFAKVLSCLSHRDSVVYQGSDKSGGDLKNDVIVSLFSSDVNTSCIVQLISAIKDIDLSDDELKLVSESVLKSLPDVELIELPSFVYQLLLLSSKGQRQQILQGVVAHFIKQDQRFQGKSDSDQGSEDLIENDTGEDLYRQTEGTVILMISVSSRHDQNIGKEFATLLKKVQHKTEIVLSPFSFATALSLSKIHSNKDDIFESLKKSLTAAYQLKAKKSNSLWMRDMITASPEILELVKEVIRSSQFGWDHVCQGLVKFGFSAIDTFGPRYIAGNAVKSVSEEGCQLGSHILRDTFKSHRIVRPEVLDQILNQIVTKSQKPVKHYIDILSQIVQSDPLFLMDVLPKIVEILDYIHFLPYKNAVAILQALAPVMKISMPLKDTLMLVLRKALFHRDIEARKVAVSGYLMVLKKLNFIGRVTLSQSQTSLSSQASSASMISTQVRADVYVSVGNPSSKTMCLEIMGLLKRVLMQQGVVRQLLYEGLYDAVFQNKSLRDIVLELLLGQFEKYYDSNEDCDVPLNFNLCLQEQKEGVALDEPLAHLITTIHLILQETGEAAVDDEDYDLSAQKMLEESLQKLSRKLSEVDVADLNVHTKDSDDSVSDTSLSSSIILNVYESILEYSLMEIKSFSKEDCDQLLKLYHKYNEIYESVSSKKEKKPAKGKSNVPALCMQVTLRFFSTILHSLFVDGTFRHQDGLEQFRKDPGFVTHILKSCNQKLLKLSENGINDGYSEVMPNSFDLVLNIAKIYFKNYTDDLSFTFRGLGWERVSTYFADGLASVFTYISVFHAKNAGKFINGLCSDNPGSTSQALHTVLKAIQKSIMKILTDTENDANLKETIPLLSIIKILYNLFTEDFNDYVYKWMKQLCTQQVFQNGAVSKAFVSLCLTLGNQQPNILIFLREIAFDLHYHLDDIDPEKKVRGTPKHNIITPEVARSIIPNLISTMELLLDEAEYVLNFMKANAVIPTEFLSLASSGDSNIQNMEDGVSTRLSDIIQVFYELVQTGVPADHTSTSIFKLVARFYRILTAMAKYYLLRHTKSKRAELHPSFEKLVKLSHTKLTNSAYAFITYIQVLNEGGDRKKKVKSSVAAAKAMREIRTVPTLVFAIESYEKNLIVLSKKYNRNLVNHMKLSTARDFRINADALANANDEDSQEANSTVDENSVDGADNNEEVAADDEEPVNDASDHEEVQNDEENNASEEEILNNPSEEEIGGDSSDNDETVDNIRLAATSSKNNKPEKTANKSAAISKILSRSKAGPLSRKIAANASLSKNKATAESSSKIKATAETSSKNKATAESSSKNKATAESSSKNKATAESSSKNKATAESSNKNKATDNDKTPRKTKDADQTSTTAKTNRSLSRGKTTDKSIITNGVSDKSLQNGNHAKKLKTNDTPKKSRSTKRAASEDKTEENASSKALNVKRKRLGVRR
ncbi:hypothetical protein JTE90_020983 [Oedothorax gibbosus]|uniref:Fanconi anemia group I protein n=1 Tax=Oedothorax gibbosus TaxID=931172 RepID=A0AAV6U0B5_9ARAC|nr:hypothetical protein JTE90_020983 [Oedothorax gibbosus]